MTTDQARRSRINGRILAVAALPFFVLLAVGTGCRGFFINQPNSVTVIDASGNSTFSVAVNATDQLKATATFDSGTKDVTNSASWQSSTSCVTVGATGLVKGIGPVSSVTITASVGGVSGTITGAVTGSGGSTLRVAAPTTGIIASGTGQFTATLNGSDVTSSSTWSSDNTSAVSFSTTQPGFATFGTSGQSANVTASLNQGTTCATGTLAVTIP